MDNHNIGGSHFSDRHIDEIRAETEENYFTSVLEDVSDEIATVETICDLGCGNGVFTASLRGKFGCRLVGVDGSDYALKQAKVHGFDALHLVEDFSSSRLPFEKGVFDFVINKDVLEHLLHPEHLVGEMARIVRPGGYALIHVPNHFPLVGRIILLLHNKLDPFDYFPDSRRWDFPHIRFFTRDDLCVLFEMNGFTVARELHHHFFTAGRLGRLFPTSFRKWLCSKYPDAWTEGYTILFRRCP